MFRKKPAISDPFWKDGPANTDHSALGNRQARALKHIFYRTLIVTGLLFFVAIYFMSEGVVVLWCLIGTFLGFLGLSAFARNRINTFISDIGEIQARARKQTNAQFIGSAIHVAGHPLLERDQQIVMALSGNQLSFYAFDSSRPLDTIDLHDIGAIQPIVYDDERVPYLDVLDSAAQALQLQFERNGGSWKCVFRSMKAVRPIDWYHALQQAKFHLAA